MAVLRPRPGGRGSGKISEVLANARRSLPGAFSERALPAGGRVEPIISDLAIGAATGADWVAGKRARAARSLKHKVLAQIMGGGRTPEEGAVDRPSSDPRASSLSELGNGERRGAPIQWGRHPASTRSYLLPLVELCRARPTRPRKPPDILRGHWHLPPDRPQGDRRPYRRPLPRGRLARGAVAW